jgi:hypothetical protein
MNKIIFLVFAVFVAACARETDFGEETGLGGEGEYAGEEGCAEGLTPTSDLVFNDETLRCELQSRDLICINCGDGVCGPGENICNCATDCA